MRNFKRLFVLIALLLPLTVSAQRTAPKEWYVAIDGIYTFSGPGINVSAGQYGLYGYWESGLSYTKRTFNVEQGGTAEAEWPYLFGDYMFRVLATRDRSLNLYLGPGAFIGFEKLNLSDLVPEDIAEELKDGKLIEGFYPKAELEWFFTRTVALSVQAKAPFAITGRLKRFTTEVGAGIKINF